MISWPWLIVAFACGGVSTLIGLIAYLTCGFDFRMIGLWNIVFGFLLDNRDELDRRFKAEFNPSPCSPPTTPSP